MDLFFNEKLFKMSLKTLIQNLEDQGFDTGQVNENKFIVGEKEVTPGVFETTSFSKAFWVLKDLERFKIEYFNGQLFTEIYFTDVETTLDYIKGKFSLDKK